MMFTITNGNKFQFSKLKEIIEMANQTSIKMIIITTREETDREREGRKQINKKCSLAQFCY